MVKGCSYQLCNLKTHANFDDASSKSPSKFLGTILYRELDLQTSFDGLKMEI